MRISSPPNPEGYVHRILSGTGIAARKHPASSPDEPLEAIRETPSPGLAGLARRGRRRPGPATLESGRQASSPQATDMYGRHKPDPEVGSPWE